MNARLAELLDHLAATLTAGREVEIEELHRRALSWQPVKRLPLILSYPAPPDRWVPYPHADALADPEKMLFNELVLRGWGGGGLHSCGDFSYKAAEYLDLASLQCLDLGQAELNDLDKLYFLARQRRIPLLRISVSRDELVSGSVLRRFPTGASLLHAAKCLEDAREVSNAYREATHSKP